MSSFASAPDAAISPLATEPGRSGGPATVSADTGGRLPAEVVAAIEAYKQRNSDKVVILFQPTGSAPVLKQKYRKITSSNKFQTVIAFLRKELGWRPQDSLFLYINAAFSPAPDDTLGNLYKCFGTEGYLIVNYSASAAWG